LFTERGKQVIPKSSLEEIIVTESFSAQTQEDIKATENGSKSDSNLKAILKSVPHKEEAVEELEEDWSSNSEEDFVLSEQKLAQRDDINLMLAQNFMFENSGLTQQQIMAVIQYQNAVEGEIQQDNECFLSPDQPSTSGKRSKEIAFVDDSDALTLRGLQDNTSRSSYSQASAGTTSEVNCTRQGVSSSAEGSSSGNGVSNTCDANVLDKWKVNVLNGKTIDEKNYTVRQEVSITQTNDISASGLSPVGNKQKDSNNAIEQMTSDSDSDTGFVEVAGAIMQPGHCLTSEKNALEVIIQQDKVCEMEDDIFNDIFCAQTSDRMLTINTNLPVDTIINPASDDNINAGLGGTKNGKFDKENMRNEISGGKEDNKSMPLEDGKELVENTKTQDNCIQKDVKAESDVGTSHGVELEEGSKHQVTRTALSSVEPEEDSTKQVTRTTLSSEELQKLQVLALYCCDCLFVS